MPNFTVPTRENVSEGNQDIFDKLSSMIGFVPNLYAYFANNETALGDYLTLQNRKSTLKAKEREVINLVVSQVNDCEYCLAAHTAIGKMNGFSDDEVIAIRKAEVGFDPKLAALASFVRETTENRGKPSAEAIDRFFATGYGEAELVDVVIVIGDKIITNYLHGITQVAIDWEAAPKLDVAASV
jgi:uncharacterized peroxidase-related enzyme